MGDLIDRSALLDAMDKRYIEKKDIVPNNLAEGFMQMEKLIKEQPTAYDIDKVVADIKAYPAGSHIERQIVYNIIRKGGVNDNNRTC